MLHCARLVEILEVDMSVASTVAIGVYNMIRPKTKNMKVRQCKDVMNQDVDCCEYKIGSNQLHYFSSVAK
jgi:copper homeostasis protein CutC